MADAPARPGTAAPGGKKILGLKPRTAYLVGGGVFLAAVAFFYLRRKKSATTGTTGGTSASTSAGAHLLTGGNASEVDFSATVLV